MGCLLRLLKKEEWDFEVSSEANTRRIQAVEEKFGASGQPLQVPGRVLVGEGVLVKMCRKKPKPRQFYLFNDILVYGSILISKKRFNKQHVVPLEDIHLEDIDDDGVYAATPLEKKEWMVHISRCIQDLLTKSGKKAGSDYAAVWVPDADARFCMQCKESRFSLVNRRHHCRNCGAVVCGPCSSKRWKLGAISRQPVRVCNHCYDQLSSSAVGGLAVSGLPDAVSATPTANAGGEASDDWSSEDSDEESSSGLAGGQQQTPSFYDAAQPASNAH